MATAATTLIQRVRRFVRDYPEYDTLGASITNSATTITTTVNPASGTYTANQLIQVDQEAMLVKTANTGAASITVMRGASGTTSASHTNSSTVLVNPNWLDVEILDELNNAIDACYPWIYRPVIDESLTILSNTYEYTVPYLPSSSSVRIPAVTTIELKDSGDTDYYKVRDWEIRRGATPKIKFRRVTSVGATVRINGYGPFAHLAITDSLDALWPANAEDVLVLYVASQLLASGEARRVRADRGAVDTREQANRVGGSMSAANQLWNRYQQRLRDAAMPPMPKHIRTTL